jgi:CheY-like chemotaxis protein
VTDSGDPHRDLAGVLHDVSNALTVLLGWVEEARSPDATPEAVSYALGIVEQRARIARDLARHAIGSPRIDEQRDASAIVNEIAEALRVEAQHTGTKLVVHGASASARVAGALDVSQVLTNLVLNALAYAPLGSTVDISLSVDDETCTIIVADEGPGIGVERRESVFHGDSRRPGGAGVGLRHSRALARSWGGDVDVLVHDGKGARLRVTWPRADAVPRPPVSTSRVGDLTGVRVLVVEDDAAVNQLLDAVLDARGARVTIATSRGDLAAALDRGPYDAALVDLSPIAHDPAAELERLRGACPGAAVVLITGNADALPEAVAAHAVELVRKPFEVREVVAAIARRARPRTP